MGGRPGGGGLRAGPGKAPWAPACVVGVGAQPRVAGPGRALEAVLTVYSLTGQNPVGQRQLILSSAVWAGRRGWAPGAWHPLWPWEAPRLQGVFS